MKQTKGLLFDKDGTILEFDGSWQNAAQNFGDYLGQVAPVSAPLICQKIGIEGQRLLPNTPLYSGTYYQIAAIMRDYPPFSQYQEADLVAAISDFFYQYLLAHLSEVRLIGDVAGLFKELRQQGFLIGIATSDSRQSTEKILTHFDLMPYVDFIATGDDYPAKPDPTLLKAFAKQYQLPQDQIYVVGDSTVDILLGEQAGGGILVGNTRAAYGGWQYPDIHGVPYHKLG